MQYEPLDANQLNATGRGNGKKVHSLLRDHIAHNAETSCALCVSLRRRPEPELERCPVSVPIRLYSQYHYYLLKHYCTRRGLDSERRPWRIARHAQ